MSVIENRSWLKMIFTCSAFHVAPPLARAEPEKPFHHERSWRIWYVHTSCPDTPPSASSRARARISSTTDVFALA
jgi:hypothetical protein